MSNILDLIQQQRAIDNEAWQTFNSEYERRNPPPQQKSNWLTVGMWSGLVAALILSGLMTIPSFSIALQGADVWYPLALIGGVAGFIAIDLVMFFSTYSLTTMYYRPKAIEGKLNLKELMIVIGIAGIFGFIVSAGSNFYMMFNGYDVFEEDSEEQHNFTLGIAFLLALAPPIQATATGSILAQTPLSAISRPQFAVVPSSRQSWAPSRRQNNSTADTAIRTTVAILCINGLFSHPLSCHGQSIGFERMRIHSAVSIAPARTFRIGAHWAAPSTQHIPKAKGRARRPAPIFCLPWPVARTQSGLFRA
jgi:hypothetical protein